MNIEELIHGESKNIEYKEMLPSNSDKYTKTVVAFANTQGGKIVFGIADGTNEIVGIDNSILFQMYCGLRLVMGTEGCSETAVSFS